MKKYVSLSKYPGKTGQYFYNEFFKHYGIDAVYEPWGTDNLYKSMEQVIKENVAGFSVSMPYKVEILEYLDKRTGYCDLYYSCNTVNIEHGHMVGYNTDIFGVQYACKQITPGQKITILGAGAMGSMFVTYLEEAHFGNFNLCSRKSGKWENRTQPTDVVVNATGLGTSTKDSPFTELPEGVSLVIDLAIRTNDLEKQCMDKNIKYISGREFYKEQFLKQFKIYTGVDPERDVFDRIERRLYETI